MRFGVLGPLLASGKTGPIAVGGQRERTLLAYLLSRPNEVVPVAALIEVLWGDIAPARAGKTVQTYVLRLRQAVDPDRRQRASDAVVVTQEPGYLLRVDPGDLDALCFQQLVIDGRQALRAGDPVVAATALEQGLTLWRGPAYLEFRDTDFGAAEGGRLEELRIAALEDRVAAHLELGRDGHLVEELEHLVQQHPLRERFWGQLMVALYRSERQAQALHAYQRARGILTEELGIEPGAPLRALHQAVLAQDPSLDSPWRRDAPVGAVPAALDVAGHPIVGRTDEIAWLNALWQRAADGHGGVVFVSGPRGIGKTRLAAALADEAHRGGAVILYGRYDGVADGLRTALRGAGRLLPSGDDPGQQVLTLAGGRAVLLVLDDVHAAAADELEILSDLGEWARDRPVLVLGLHRDDAAGAAALPSGRAPTRRLQPLPAASVAEIVAGYPGAAEHAGEIGVRSQGLPLFVHDLAVERSRAAAAARIDQAVGRAAGGRRELLAVQSDIAADVAGLQELGRSVAEPRPGEAAGDRVRCPFKGLARYEMDDAEFFCGREQLVAELTAALVGVGFLGVVGPSGSGKSSLVRAGLLPALRDGILPGSERWEIVVLRPGDHPLAELSRVVGDPDAVTLEPLLVRAGGSGTRVVVFVDQFEEVFTSCREEDERRAFLDALTAAGRDAGSRAAVVVALRADYYGRCAAYRDLARLLGANHVLVGPLRADEARTAIEVPARRGGLRLEDGLVDRILDDVAGQPGALPLLSTALLALWQHRVGTILTVSAYTATGGVTGAVARLAERAFADLTPDQQNVTRRVLLRLTGPGEGDAVVRRRLPLSDVDELGADVRAVVDLLADRRLLSVSEGAVEVAHEALLREWPRLRGWLDEDVHGRRLHRHLTTAAHDWDGAGRDRAELYRGARLSGALDWAAGHADDLSPLERDFLDVARADSERETAAARARERATARMNRRLRAALALGSAVLVVAVVAAGLAAVQSRRAEREALLALSRRVGGQALLEEHLDRSLLLAATAVDLHDSAQTRSALLASLARRPEAVAVLRAETGLLDLAVSPDGSLLAGIGRDGRIVLWDPGSRQQAGDTLGFDAQAHTAAVTFSRDGRLLAAGWGDGDVSGRLRVWELPARRLIADEELIGTGNAVAFSADDTTLAVGMGDSVRLWDRDSGKSGIRTFRADGGGDIDGVALGPDGRLVTSSAQAGSTHVWDVASGRQTRTLPFGGPVAISPDGEHLAVGAGSSAVLVDGASGDVLATLDDHTAPVTGLSFSADGRSLATVSQDKSAIVWNVRSREPRLALTGHALTPFGVGFGAGDRTLYTAGIDATAVVWDLSGDRWFGQPFQAPPESWLAYSHDGSMLATGAGDGSVTLWDPRTRAPSGPPLPVFIRRGMTTPVWNGALSPDASLLAATTSEGVLALWDTRARTPVGYHGEEIGGDMEFSPDGTLLAISGTWSSPGRLLDVAKQTWTDVGPGIDGRAHDLAFNPDGSRLAIAMHSGEVVVRDVKTGAEGFRVVADAQAAALAVTFSPDGRLLVTGGANGWVRFWDADSGRPSGAPLQAHGEAIVRVDVSADSSTLVTAGRDGQVMLWDIATRTRIGAALPGSGSVEAFAAFGPTGAPLATIQGDGAGRLFDLDWDSLRARACAIAGRNLTPAEWQQHVPERPYRAVCPDQPRA